MKERNTWWEMSGGWHLYLSRCQEMLRQGLFVADLLYLRPQNPNQKGLNPNGPAYQFQPGFAPIPAVPAGYKYDEISAEALISRAGVKDGRIVLPDGMSYRLLVLPAAPMTIELLQKIERLVAEGATVMGPRPTASPTLTGYPESEKEVVALAKKIWGNDAAAPAHVYGKGRVISGESMETALTALQPARFPIDLEVELDSSPGWRHRHLLPRKRGGCPRGNALRLPRRGKAAPAVESRNGRNFRPGYLSGDRHRRRDSAPLRTCGVLLRRIPPRVVAARSGHELYPQWKSVIDPSLSPRIEIRKATYGVPGNTQQSRDVRSRLQSMVNAESANSWSPKWPRATIPLTR